VDDALLEPLTRLAYNLRWTWEPTTARLFASIAPDVWRVSHNPVAVLDALTPAALKAHAGAIQAAHSELADYLRIPSRSEVPTVAYLSAEYALTECLPMYSGGLGVLAADHLKAASDLGLPMLGIGLLYYQGYFRQVLDEMGHQREQYERLDPTQLPLRPVRLPDGELLRVSVPFPGRRVSAAVWLAQVGRVPLYLLDTNLECNREDDRWITAHLYGGDSDTRLRQEMILGIGGGRLLRALDYAPTVYHLNDGHAAFLIVELAREALEHGAALTFDAALEQVAHHVVFTTHTRLAASHDAFPVQLMEAYLHDYLASFGVQVHDLLRVARPASAPVDEPFSMTYLALRGASQRNAVSPLHGAISRDMWSSIGVGARDVPPIMRMTTITNGVHTQTWAGPDMAALFDTHLGGRWRTTAAERTTWQPLLGAPHAALWAARTSQRARLLARVEREVWHSSVGCSFPTDLDPARLMIIGFARRFTSYKRATLLLRDHAALSRLLASDKDRQVLIVFAGKAHPRDDPGKLMIQRVVDATHDERNGGRLVFLPDYDLELARLLVQGSDVWLNTPRRTNEASGTSGMKAVLNGALHLSELDGWWDEAFRPGIGWALGRDLPDEMSDEARDVAESAELIELLEHEVLPLFFDRDAADVPVRWLERVSRSITTLAPAYSAERMVCEYVERLYRAVGDRSGMGQAILARSQVLSSAR
jgi:starch phosphorylase